MKPIVEQVIENSRSNPDKIAVCDGKSAISFAELAGMILSAKETLVSSYHIAKGDAIIIAADKQLEFVGVYFACHLIGAIALPIAPDTNEKRYDAIKDRAHPVLTVGFYDGQIPEADFSEFAERKRIADHSGIVYPSLDDVADIMFTTGTTGEPKGVQLTHRNIAAAARNINAFVQNEAEDVEMIALPVSHSFGIGRMRCALSNGQTVIMLGSFANVKRFFGFIERYHVTGFGMVPASWALLKRMSGMKINEYKEQLHYIEIGSAPMPTEEKQGLMDALPNTRICMHYGLTEASRSAFMEFHECADRLTTVGKQTPNMTISIKDENGIDLPNGVEGEICVAGDAVTVGYLNISKEKSFWDMYFRTGDWGVRDDDGFITLKSRKKELINVGGKKVSPMEVEAVLMDFDFVEDCACVGIPDPEGILGEVVKAYLVTQEPDKADWGEMDRRIGERLESYKHPAEYAVVNEIPKTSSGKVQRLLLK